MAARDGWCLRNRTGRRRGGRVAGAGLRVLRRAFGTGAGARWRFYQERDGCKYEGARNHGAARGSARLKHDREDRVSAKWISVFLATNAKRLRGDHAQTNIEEFGAGKWLRISTATGSRRVMGAGRRSTISYSARCSITAANRPFLKPT